MPSVELSNEKWQWLINVLAEKLTWKEANPILMEIGQQLQAQHQAASNPPNIALQTNSTNSGEDHAVPAKS